MRIGVVEIIARHVPKQDHGGPSVSTYLLLAALNRCTAPPSSSYPFTSDCSSACTGTTSKA